MSKEILFTIAQDNSYNTTSVAAKLEGLRRKGFERYYDNKFLEEYITKVRQERKEDAFSFSWCPYNAPGQWMSENISLPNKVIPEPITLEKVKEELDSGRFDYIVIATYLSGYSTFREIANYVRKKHPEVKVVAASVGALVSESSQLADFTLKGDQVGDLRAIIGQPQTDSLKVVTVRSDTATRFNGIAKKGSYALLVSSLGCMYGCDFCPATAQFGKEYMAPFSAQEIKQAIISTHDKIAPDSNVFTVSVAEPQGLGNVKLWKEVFRLCRDLPFQCDLVSTTSSKVIQRYSLDELTSGALRLSTVNIGVESLLQGYRKNQGVDLKALNSRLQEAGINVVSTFIVGLDWQTKENIREEVRLLKDLGSSGYIVANLEMQPGTPLYTAFKRSGRLLDVPPELLSFYGYQAFTHPHFASGFNDMLPLLGDIEDELAEGNQTLGANLRVFLKRKSESEAKQRSIINQIIRDFSSSLDPKAYKDDVSIVVDKFSAELYFHLAFRQMDLFHPFILSTN
jgi:pyruvate-formate lyase-activating enzyme